MHVTVVDREIIDAVRLAAGVERAEAEAVMADHPGSVLPSETPRASEVIGMGVGDDHAVHVPGLETSLLEALVEHATAIIGRLEDPNEGVCTKAKEALSKLKAAALLSEEHLASLSTLLPQGGSEGLLLS